MLRTRRLLPALLGLFLLALPGCSGSGGPTEATEAPAALERLPEAELLDRLDGPVGGILQGLLSCRALPEASASAWIGPLGGTLRAGPHTLVVPAGALSRRVEITMQAPSDRVSSVVLSPHGLTFSQPAKLTLSYAHCSLAARLLPKRVAYTTKRLEILSYLLSLDDLLRQEVTGSLPHFSRYAVAW